MKMALIVLLSLWTTLTFAVGGIPTQYMNDPAVDLVRHGKLLMPDEVHQLHVSSKGRFDISTLNPIETSDLWKDQYPKTLKESRLPIFDMDEVSFHSKVLTQTGMFRFNVQAGQSDGRFYTMVLGKTIHSILLAKAVLEKIGYIVPDIRYLPRVIVSFKDEAEKKSFLYYLEHETFAGSPKNWVVEELEGNKLLLQDIVVTEANSAIYNLAMNVGPDMIAGRRLLSSLVVPLTIVNLTESVNMLRWSAGEEANGEVMLIHEKREDYQCTWDDARWITRRLEKLSRQDWEEIVATSNVPKPVQMILTEKIISRRNSVMKLFKIDHKEFKVDSELTSGTDLVEGKITKQDWPGYASRFAYGDPDSPLSGSEIKSLVGSKAISLALDGAVSTLNNMPFMSYAPNITDQTNFQELINKATQKSVDTGTPNTIPVIGWIVPTISGQLIASRNVVTGTYLGTDNLIQLADTIGVSVQGGISASVGVTLGDLFTGGAFSAQRVASNASSNDILAILTGRLSAQVNLVRTYSHLRPVTSMEKSLKYPFYNVLVPLVNLNYGKKLYDAAMASIDETLSDEEREAKVAEALKPFKQSMEVGESLMVTDSVGTLGGLDVTAGHRLIMKASLGILPNHLVISRFHVHRKSEHEFHIYKDVGHSGGINLNFEINSWIPIAKVGYRANGGNARVKFYSINLHPKNPKVLENASQLRRAIVWSSTRDLDENEETKPFVVTHNFTESNPKAGILVWQWQHINSSTNVTVTHPKGEKRYYRRQYYGNSTGRNYQAFAAQMISNWISMIFEKQVTINDGTGANPGYSFQGAGETKFVTFDEEVTDKGAMIEPFIKVTTIKNGWSIDRKKAKEILNKMTIRYRHNFYSGPVLNDTRRIFLYNISVNMFFYQKGIEYLFKLSDDEIKAIFRRHQSRDNLVTSIANVKDTDTNSGWFLGLMKDFRRFENWKWEKSANTALMKAFSFAEENLTISGLCELMGGKENVYMMSRIDGFREGDEDGDRPFISSSIGEFGSERVLGPLVQMQKQTNMLEGEFFIYWLMTRLI